MKTPGFGAIFGAAALTVLAVGAFSAGAMQTAAAAECAGAFRQCAIEVSAVCSRDADGKQRMTYWDHAGNVTQFERCVGGIFEAAGQPNPYKTSARGSGGLEIPYTELLYPTSRDSR
jgi:hypothetical protein